MVQWQIERILKAKKISKLVLATSLDSLDDPLANCANKWVLLAIAEAWKTS